MNIAKLEKKIVQNIEETTKGLFERTEIVKLSYLALLSSESVFMLGLPGVAKSLIARRMKFVMENEKHFECLMNKFSTPEEIFGPISIKELEKDNYVRKIEGYLPTAEIAFLDEIWKASPAIQNTLLTIINEKIFKNGTAVLNVPLKLLMAASNELPQKGEGLEALYDRFLIRYYVNPALKRESFENIIDSKDELDFSPSNLQKITTKEILEIKKFISNVKTSSEVLDFINEFKNRLEIELSKKKPYISDRRWKKIVNVMKTNAFISGRKEVVLSDLFVVKHCSWETNHLQKQIESIFNETFIESITKRIGSSINEVENMLASAKKMFKEGYKNTKKHENRKLGGFEYYKYSNDDSEFYYWIPIDENRNVAVTVSSHKEGGSTWINGREDEYCQIWYYEKRDERSYLNRLSEANSENWHTDQMKINKDWSIAYENQELKPVFKGAIKINSKKINESTRTANNALMHNARLMDHINEEIGRLKRVNSTFAYDQNYIFDKSKAVIIDKTKKLNEEIAKTFGEIQNARKSKEKN